MSNRYANLTPSKKISEDFQNITIGFDKVELEMDKKPNASIAKVNTIEMAADDTLMIEAGTGIDVIPVPGEKKLRIVATGTSTPGLHGPEHGQNGSDPIPELVQLEEDFNEHLADVATATELGHVKAGANITIDPDGTINAVGEGPLRRYLAGFEPERLSATTLRLLPGSAVDGAATPTDVIQSLTNIDIDVTTTGLNGLDVGVIEVGEDYYPYILKNPTTGQVGAVISKEVSFTNVTKPEGFTLIRKLPFGFIYKSNGIPAFHLSGWPLPFIRYTDFEASPSWAALTDGTATTNTLFSMASHIPDNARLAYLCCVVEGDSGAGEAFLRVVGSGFPVGYVNDVGDKTYTFVHVRVTTALSLYYRVTGGAKLSVYVAGYSQTERT